MAGQFGSWMVDGNGWMDRQLNGWTAGWPVNQPVGWFVAGWVVLLDGLDGQLDGLDGQLDGLVGWMNWVDSWMVWLVGCFHLFMVGWLDGRLVSWFLSDWLNGWIDWMLEQFNACMVVWLYGRMVVWFVVGQMDCMV